MKFILAVLLGFVLNSGLRTYYSYMWWSTQAQISRDEMNASYDQNKYFKIVNDKMGIVDYLKYPLITAHYPFEKWELRFP